MSLKVTISHPHGNPNSFHAARAFAEADWLRSFRSGVGGGKFTSKFINFLPDDARERLQSRPPQGVPQLRQHSHLLWEMISRCGQRLMPEGPTASVSWYDVLFCGHDLQVSRRLESDLDAVYAYEDGAKWTFTTAKRQHAATIYELPLGYYKGVAHELVRAKKERPLMQFDFREEPLWKQQRKNDELELADLVVVPCTWAAESLSYSNISKKTAAIKIPYGTPADEIAARDGVPDAPFTVLFAGQVGLRKGVPHLLEAWRQLGLKDARLWLTGWMNLSPAYLDEHAGLFEYLGCLPRARLMEVMKRADLLVFPSLAEGFGLVIGEALACGVPVLTTTNTGGPELITEGQEGWCIPAHDVEALADRLKWAHENRDALCEMGRRARLKAEGWTWADYRRELTTQLSQRLN